MFLRFVFATFAIATTLQAQIIDTVGGTTTAATRTNSSKASLYRVDSTVLLTEFEWWLSIPAAETLTFYAYRHHSRSGVATLEWSQSVPVTGTGLAQWYSTGPIALPLVAGNHYALGVSWPGSLTYHYQTATTNAPVSFGTWQRAHTLTNPVPATLTIPAGVDVAQYHQRLTSLSLTSVVPVGTGCSSTALIPRLVASGLFSLGSNEGLDLVDCAPNTLALYGLAVGPTLPTPMPLFGCNFWLNPAGTETFAQVTSATGVAFLGLSVPQNPVLFGLPLSTQAAIVGTSIDFANAIDFVVQ
ncbi:MAG: hypothetical protein IPK26_00165 [Planctomycetes bacterium]|nr:hypothetical protein [Planctomycetota bacterium]